MLHLNVDNFKPELKKRKHVLVMFYAPCERLLVLPLDFDVRRLSSNLFLGCGHCKKAKPEFMMAASRFKDDPKVAFAAVDCTVHQDVCRQYEIQGYPTIKYFSYLKTVVNYETGRTVSEPALKLFFYTVVFYFFADRLPIL